MGEKWLFTNVYKTNYPTDSGNSSRYNCIRLSTCLEVSIPGTNTVFHFLLSHPFYNE